MPRFDLASLAPALEQREPGLWFARQRQECEDKLTRNGVPRMEIPVKTEVTTNREAPQRISAVAVLACAWPALLLATVCLLPS